MKTEAGQESQAIYKSEAGRTAILKLYARVLAQWPVPVEKLMIPTRHGETFVLAWGKPGAKPLLLLHGSGSNSATWMGDAPVYGEHFRVFAADLPGEPGKSAAVRFSWEGPAFTEWIDDLRQELALPDMILGGMSLGAWAAIQYAGAHPMRVSQAILIVPSGVCQPRLSFVARLIWYALLGARGRQKMKAYLFEGLEMSPELDEFLTLVGEEFNFRTGAPPLFSDDELKRLTMPVLFLAGRHDRMLNTPKSAARLEELLPDVTINILDDAGHATVNTAAEVLRFLEAKPATGTA